MSKWNEDFEQYAMEVITGQRRSLGAAMLRVLLLLLSGLYRAAVQLRLTLYRRRVLEEHTVGCMVISVGNLTVGGTGKTPVVEKLARELTERGRKVAVLSRGYRSARPPLLRRLLLRLTGRTPLIPPRLVSDGKRVLLDSRMAGDEPFMLAQNLPGVGVVVDKDRVKCGLHAIKNLGSNVLILDDGLQYLRLKRRVNIVLVDCQTPFGNGHLLPRGILREPTANLGRAHYIILTKSHGEDQSALIARIRRHNRAAEIIETRHCPLYLEHAYTGERRDLTWLDGLFVGALSGIARPESFHDILRGLNARVEVKRSFADHHRFSEKEILAFADRCLHRDLAAIITTQKDAVRLPHIERMKVPIYFLRVEIEILKGQEVWDACLRRICHPVFATADGERYGDYL